MPLKVGLHRPASEAPLKWRFAGVPLNAGLVALQFLGDPDQYR